MCMKLRAVSLVGPAREASTGESALRGEGDVGPAPPCLAARQGSHPTQAADHCSGGSALPHAREATRP
jgi:hypothetical protein